MGFKKFNQNCYSSDGSIIREDLYVKYAHEELFLRLSETFFIDCLVEFGSKNEWLLAFLLYNVNHNTNIINFTETEIIDYLTENSETENSIKISKRKIHESINKLIENQLVKRLDDGKFIFNPNYINCTRKSFDKLYVSYMKSEHAEKSTKKLQTIKRTVKPIGCLKKDEQSITYDFDYIRIYTNRLAENEYFTSKKVKLFLSLIKMAEDDDRGFDCTYNDLTGLYVKKDTVRTVMKYMLEQEYICREHNSKYLFNSDYISKSYPFLRMKNLQKFYQTLNKYK